MNERIEEFAKDCKILGEKEFAGKVVGFNYKKFAELLIKECAEIADKNSPLSYPDHGIKIKRHFGVEE